MKKNSIILASLLLIAPFLGFSQDKGIQFEQSLSWKQVVEKAKETNKYIFVDCYATWCGPCKEMDQNIYPQEKVGDYFNDKFISVKFQLDSSKADNEDVRNRYADAHEMVQQYKISGLPTFLFFSPDGTIVHRAMGMKSMDDLILLATDALNPAKQYNALLRKYNNGERDYPQMAYLAVTAKSLNEPVIAQTIAKDYTDHYLLRLKDQELYTKENIVFIENFSQSSKDKGFSMFYHHGDQIDKTMGDSIFSRNFIDYVIAKEEIDPQLWPSSGSIPDSPNWSKITSNITKKYNNTYAYRTVTGAKVRWYGWKKDWPEYAKYLVARWELSNGMSNDLITLDTDLYSIFQHSTDTSDMNKAIFWMEQLWKKIPEQQDPENMDTYACLLYKVGRKQEALEWQEKVVKLKPDDKEVLDHFNKMKRGEPTWE